MKNRKTLNDRGWEVIEIFDIKSKKLNNIYFHKDRKACRKILKSTLSQIILAYSLIDKDLRNIKGWLSIVSKFQSKYQTPTQIGHYFSHVHVKDQYDMLVIKSLFIAILTTYGRLFAKSSKRQRSLQRAMIKDSEMLDIHDMLIEYRNNFSAHCGQTDTEQTNIIMAYLPNKLHKVLPEVFTEISQPTFIMKADEIIRLVEYLEAYNNKHLEKCHSKLYLNEVLKELGYTSRTGRILAENTES